MPGGTSKVTCCGVSDGQLTNPKSCTACWIQCSSDSHTQEVVERPSEFSIHLVLSQGRSKHKMQNLIHPSKALAISQEFHRQTTCCQDCHSRNKFCLWNEVVQACKEKSKASMQHFSSKVGGIAALQKNIKLRTGLDEQNLRKSLFALTFSFLAICLCLLCCCFFSFLVSLCTGTTSVSAISVSMVVMTLSDVVAALAVSVSGVLVPPVGV